MQPQQQFVVTNAGLVQPVHVSQTYQVADVINSYRQRQSTVIGILLIVAGCLSIVFNAVDLGLGTKEYFYYRPDVGGSVYRERLFQLSDDSLGVFGYGFWCGVLIIVVGAFGIAAARYKIRLMIIIFMVSAIIGVALGAAQGIIGAIGASKMHRDIDEYVPDGCGLDYCDAMRTLFALAILLAIFGFIEMGLCVWGWILCCVYGVPCTRTTVVMMPAGEQMSVIPISQQQQQQQQPIVMANPQTYPPQQVVYQQQYPEHQIYPKLSDEYSPM